MKERKKEKHKEREREREREREYSIGDVSTSTKEDGDKVRTMLSKLEDSLVVDENAVVKVNFLQELAVLCEHSNRGRGDECTVGDI